jgi:hypothetical protein
MTAEQAKQITELRQRGVGYRIIAQQLGLDRDKVRYFCKTKGIAGIATETLIEQGKICKNCQKPIVKIGTRGRKKKFCCEECRRSYWKAHPDEAIRTDMAMYKATCACCEKEFTTYGNNHRKYCSRECYIKARFWEE